MSYTWIKAYTEILDDPKMGRMSDHLWRRTIEIFLLAGKIGKSGELPSVEEIAWTLRATIAEISVDLEELETLKIISREDKKLVVSNFLKRQAAMTAADRQKKRRGGASVTDNVTKRDETCHENVTEEEEEEEVDKKKTQSDTSKVIQAMTAQGMFPNSETGQMVGYWLEDHSPDWIIKALEKSKGKNQNYADAVLTGWKANGYPKTREEQLAAAKAPPAFQAAPQPVRHL